MEILLPVLIIGYLGIVYAQDQCRTVNGNAGNCILLTDCEPIKKINDLKKQTKEDLLYLRQSHCGLHLDYKPKVCCPKKSEWADFTTATPIDYNFNTKYPTPAPTKKPIKKPTRPTVPDYGYNNCNASVTPPDPNSFCCGTEYGFSDRILGGHEVAVDEFPWLALLQYERTGKTHCGGSLISSRYVVTAAHCLGQTQHGLANYVRLSEYNTSSTPVDKVEVNGGLEIVTMVLIAIEAQIPHPGYKKGESKYDDIGLVKLATEAPYTRHIRPICLPVRDAVDLPGPGILFIAAGWGSTESGQTSQVKLKVVLPYVPLEICQVPFSRNGNTKLIDTQLCAGGVVGKDTCAGDSGGPLMYPYDNNYVLAGVVSYGATFCGTEGTPGVYTNVFKYKAWILEVAV